MASIGLDECCCMSCSFVYTMRAHSDQLNVVSSEISPSLKEGSFFIFFLQTHSESLKELEYESLACPSSHSTADAHVRTRVSVMAKTYCTNQGVINHSLMFIVHCYVIH